MNNKKFIMSDYAPPEIKQLYKMLTTEKGLRNQYRNEIEILEKLIIRENDPNIREIWQHFENKSFDELKYFLFVIEIKKASDYPQSMRRTGKTKISELNTIAKKSRELSKLIKYNHWLERTPAFDFFPLDRKQDIEKQLSIKNLRMYSFLTAPIFENILEEVANKAERETKQPVLAKQPNKKDANHVYFARILSNYMASTFNDPLHKEVTSITNAIFGTEKDPQFVESNTTRKRPL